MEQYSNAWDTFEHARNTCNFRVPRFAQTQEDVSRYEEVDFAGNGLTSAGLKAAPSFDIFPARFVSYQSKHSNPDQVGC